MKPRKYESEDEAFEHMQSLGKLDFFGRAGMDYEYCVCTLTYTDGRIEHINIYRDGNVIFRE